MRALLRGASRIWARLCTRAKLLWLVATGGQVFSLDGPWRCDGCGREKTAIAITRGDSVSSQFCRDCVEDQVVALHASEAMRERPRGDAYRVVVLKEGA